MSSFSAIVNTSEKLSQARINTAIAEAKIRENELAQKTIESEEEVYHLNSKIRDTIKDIAIMDRLPKPLNKTLQEQRDALIEKLNRLRERIDINIENTHYMLGSQGWLKAAVESSADKVTRMEKNFKINREIASLRDKHARNAKGIKNATKVDERKAMITENRKTLPTYLRIAKDANYFHNVVQKESRGFDVFEVKQHSKVVKFKTNVKTGEVRLSKVGQPLVKIPDPDTREQVALNAYLHDPYTVMETVFDVQHH
jgi:hypothetical protein